MSAIMAAETARHIDKFVQFASESIGHLGEQHPLRVLYRHISRVPTNQAELVGFLMAAKSLSSRSFLRHVKNDQDEAEKLWRASRTHLGQEEPVSGSRSIKKMNSNLIGRILEVGFIRNESATSVFDREDVTAKMVFLLLVGAGVRISEPFHMWFNDVTFADLNGEQRCLPMLRHPSQAGTFIEGEGGSRRLYLIQRGLSPRNEAHKKALWAGWKNLPLDKSQAQTPAHFLHDGIEFLFAQYYFKYLGYRRELVAARVARGEGDHPFLFVSRGEDRAAGRSCIGDPYSIGAFRSAWDRALDRVERTLGEVVPRGKEHGTTPHALRHAYGRALEKCGVGQKAIQKAMHHRHILSQSPYTEPEWKQVSEALSLARSGGALLNGRPVAGVLNPYDETVELVERWRI